MRVLHVLVGSASDGAQEKMAENNPTANGQTMSIPEVSKGELGLMKWGWGAPLAPTKHWIEVVALDL